MAAMCGSTIGGSPATPTATEKTRPSSSRSPRTSSLPLPPDVAALRQATRAVPIVFVTVVDPVGAGFVDSLARPGGNATGFIRSNTA